MAFLFAKLFALCYDVFEVKNKARIMNSGDSVSDILHAKTDFAVIVRSASGAIAGDWIFKVSPDRTNWSNAHDTAFSDTKLNDIIEAAFGWYYQLTGGTGTNLIVDVAYIGPTAHLFDINLDIIKVE